MDGSRHPCKDKIKDMKSLIAAIQFITILPVGKPGSFEPKGMIQFFPVVGIIIGLLVSAFDMAVLQLWPKPVASLLDVIYTII
jgi:adenosylcobinamide-GDP ribazoletransferase